MLVFINTNYIAPLIAPRIGIATVKYRIYYEIRKRTGKPGKFYQHDYAEYECHYKHSKQNRVFTDKGIRFGGLFYKRVYFN